MTIHNFRLGACFLLSVASGMSQNSNDPAAAPVEVAAVSAPVAPNVLRTGLPYPFRYVHLAADSQKKSARNAAPPDARSTRPRMAGSSTGYIDNAIVGSQIRLRFDSDFDLQNPDRAEFFYAKCGCYRPADPTAAGPGTVPASKVNLQEVRLNVEYAPTRRFSLLAEVPVRWIQFTAPGIGIPNSSGMGDFQAGFKMALLAGEDRYLTFQMLAYFPTGDSRLGLGTNHYSVEPTILYHQRLGERWTVSGEFGDWHPIGGSNSVAVAGVQSPTGFAGDILIYGLGASYDLFRTSNYKVTPVVEFVGWSILSGLETGGTFPSTAGVTIVNAKMGARVSFQSHSSIYVGYGRELTKTSWYSDILRLEYRYAF